MIILLLILIYLFILYNNNWKYYLIKNYKIIKKEAKFIMNNIKQDKIKRNKLWKDINNVSSNWSIGPESKNNTWLNYGLILNKKPIIKNLKKCPHTYKILKKIISNGIKIHVAGFSWLKPNSYIPEHIDNNIYKVYHLGLIVPNKKCYIKSNNKKIFHKEGSIITFNDNILHSAINKSNKNRIILYLLIELS